MEDVRQVAQERASRPKKAPVGASFESERQRSKNALVKQIASQDGRNVRMIAAATETPEEKRILRVAAYCRVSTDDIDQALSIHLQIQQYMKKIKENPNWKYAGCYVDDGFSGTNTDHRQGFQKLMKDCMDGKIEVIIMNRLGGYLTNATIVNSDFKYYRSTDWGSISKEDAIAKADAVMQELGLSDMVLADAQTPREGERKGTRELYYTPSVNGLPIPGIREDRVFSDPAIGEDYQYWTYRCSEETNADTVSWYMESVWITVGRDGILSFEWDAPSTEPVVKETQTALMPFEDIASIANTMLPVVIIGPSEARSLVEIDKINGDETYMDVEITKVSLSLMRIRDKGSLQGTIVPVWDFWGTWNWYEPGGNALDAMKKGATYVTQPMLTLNAIDGNVVSRMFGY